MEKALTVPDSYPLTLNAVVSGCNQKTSRQPLMSLTDAEAQDALDRLKAVSLVFETSGGRASRYEHNFERVVGVDARQATLLGLLMLRGPQTPGELRINAERWQAFTDIAAVESTLQALKDMEETRGVSWVVPLPRAPGSREARWAHLLCGDLPPEWLEAASPSSGPAASPRGEPTWALALATLQQRVEALEAQVAQLMSGDRPVPGEREAGPPTP
jgi:uncharacterized protein